MWVEKITPDGRWKYGYGTYNKSLVDVARETDVYKQYVSEYTEGNWLFRKLSKVIELSGLATVRSKLKEVDEYYSLPTYYIWAIAPQPMAQEPTDLGVASMTNPPSRKIMGGQWNFLTGGSKKMLYYFKNHFQPCMEIKAPDLERWKCVMTSRAYPSIVSDKEAADAARDDDDRKNGGGGVLLPLLIIGGVVLYATLKR